VCSRGLLSVVHTMPRGRFGQRFASPHYTFCRSRPTPSPPVQFGFELLAPRSRERIELRPLVAEARSNVKALSQ